MRHRATFVVGVVAGVLGAGFLALVYVGGRPEPLQQALTGVPSDGSVVVEDPGADEENPSNAANRDGAKLREMSESFRNGTFLIAIRGAGFYCDDVVAARETGDEIWVARCTDVREYTVSARQTDELRVEPIYFDAPLQSERLQLDRDLRPEHLAPRRLE